MKNIFVIATLLTFGFVNAQAFIGKGDAKFQVGANFQNNGSGINASYDFGVGENISLGLSSTYLLGVESNINADFSDRVDVKARFNANIGNVLKIDENFDFYPGLNFSLKNFGGHVGARYFFTSGFGIYSEVNVPLAKYSSNLSPAEELHNQFTLNIGASFNL